MPIVYLASHNEHKVQEFAAILASRGRKDLQVLPTSRLPSAVSWDETGTTFADNARIKATTVQAALRHHGIDDAWVLADDSGLVVDALDGEPGVHSARYAGANATAADNNAKLRGELAKLASGADLTGATEPSWPARFVCVLHFIDERGRERSFRGVCDGAVIASARGEHGFGYDPLFLVAGYGGRTLAELPEDTKNQISHRRRAVDQWLAAISQR